MQEEKEEDGEEHCQEAYSEREVQLMRIALEEAKGALERREVPVGAILAGQDGSIIARGSNRANEVRNATRHAEIEALDQLPRGSDASGLQLIVTCEPCIMCAAALSISGVRSVLFGCSNHKFGGCGSVLPVHETGCISCGRISDEPSSDAIGAYMHARGGLFEASAVALLREFYMRGNPMAPKPQRRPTSRPHPSVSIGGHTAITTPMLSVMNGTYSKSQECGGGGVLHNGRSEQHILCQKAETESSSPSAACNGCARVSFAATEPAETGAPGDGDADDECKLENQRFHESLKTAAYVRRKHADGSSGASLTTSSCGNGTRLAELERKLKRPEATHTPHS